MPRGVCVSSRALWPRPRPRLLAKARLSGRPSLAPSLALVRPSTLWPIAAAMQQQRLPAAARSLSLTSACGGDDTNPPSGEDAGRRGVGKGIGIGIGIGSGSGAGAAALAALHAPHTVRVSFSTLTAPPPPPTGPDGQPRAQTRLERRVSERAEQMLARQAPPAGGAEPHASDPYNDDDDDDDDDAAARLARAAQPPLSWKTVQRALVGNTVILILKTGAWLQTGSSAMLSEAIHTLADSGNQALLLAGLHQSSNAPDGEFQYGYGRAAFFWGLVSALGMFWTGAGVTLFHGGYNLLHPEAHAVEMTAALWGVLAVSFAVDGWVLGTTLRELNESKPAGVSSWQYLRKIRDPFVTAVVMEDLTACTGVLIAAAGIGATYVTGNNFWDASASIAIGGLLGFVALQLVRMNQRFLLGHSIDPETLVGIRGILEDRPSVDNVYGVQSQWVGPATFSYKAEVDFDGTYLAARLEDKYAPLFLTADRREDVEVLMSWYAEDVTRLVEREVRDIERQIRVVFPQAAFIELEPDSKYADVEALPSDPATDSPGFTSEQAEMRKVDIEIGFEKIFQEERKKRR